MLTTFAMLLLCVDPTLAVGDGTVDGTKLSPGVTHWELIRSSETGESVMGTVQQTIKAQSFEGRDVWWIEIIQDVPGRMHMTDTFIVDRQHLQPIRFSNVRKNDKSVALIYKGNKVEGKVTKPDGSAEIISETLQPARYEGNLWGPLLASLPLREGFTANLPFFQYTDGKTEIQVKVVGKTQAPGPAGNPVDAWELEVISPKGNRILYLISEEHGELGYRVGPITQRLVQ